MDLLGMLLGTMTSGSSVDALSKKTGLSTAKLAKLLPMAIPLLMKFLTKNASSADGAASLLGALGGHKNTKSMADQIGGADEEDGQKILNHILGSDSADVFGKLAKESDMETADVQKALSNIAPGLMSGLSAATTSASKVDLSDGLDLSDLMGMFGGAASQASQNNAGSGLLGGLLGGSGNPLSGLLGGILGGNQKEEKQDDGSQLLGLLSNLMK